MTSDPIVRIDDVRATNHCTRGARRWFEQHGLDFKAFLRNGLPASTIEATGDAFGKTVAAHVRARVGGA